MKHWMLSLVIGIPLASILFGSLMFYFAFTSTDSDVRKDVREDVRDRALEDVLEQAAPLSKTSWRTENAGELP